MTKKKIAFFTGIIILALAIVFGSCYMIGRQAENEGDYLKAIEYYKLTMFLPDSKTRLQDCKYIIAENYMSEGNFVDAMLYYEQLANYKDSKSKLETCEIAIANALYNAGNYSKAQEYYSLLSNDLALEMFDRCTYQQAKQCLIQQDFEKAFQAYDDLMNRTLFKSVQIECNQAFYDTAASFIHQLDWQNAKKILNHLADADYEKAPDAIRACEYWATEGSEPKDILVQDIIYHDGFGALYELRTSYVYIPKQTSDNTQVLIYFAGGMGANLLDRYYPKSYIENYHPDAICIFMRGSGYSYMEDYMDSTLDILSYMITLQHFCPTKMAVIGSSNGGFTALKFGAYAYNKVGIELNSISILDMGMNWEDNYGIEGNLNSDEITALAQAHVPVYAFEQRHYIGDFAPVARMRRGGVDVYGIECSTKDHDGITVNAFANGMFSWTLGEVTLDYAEYYSPSLPTELREVKPAS